VPQVARFRIGGGPPQRVGLGHDVMGKVWFEATLAHDAIGDPQQIPAVVSALLHVRKNTSTRRVHLALRDPQLGW
jgi:hypothetical protein